MIVTGRGKIKSNAKDCIGGINWPSSFKKSNTSISYTDIFPNSLYIFTSIFHYTIISIIFYIWSVTSLYTEIKD